MEVSRIVFRKETKEAMEKKLTNRERGKLLYARLKECDANGKLNLASNRKEVSNLVGGNLPWVNGMIGRRYVTETLQGFDNGKPVYEYHLTGKEPNYDYTRKRRREAVKPEREVVIWQEAEKMQTNVATPIKIEITRGNMTIKVEMSDSEQVGKLITTILRGE